jgi:N-acetylmuramoyl-L-alanine amidase
MKSILYGAKFFLCAILALSVILGIAYAFMRSTGQGPNAPVSAPICAPVIVIDAGHGGEDAGAVAQDGTLEKDLNLKIALCLDALCEINGNSAVLTREDDRLLYDHYGELDDYTGKKKIYDLKNRVAIANSYENAILISIHMNSFSDSKYSGLHTYYSTKNEDSYNLASLIQSKVKEKLQPENNRVIKPGKNMYLLENLSNIAILIECGFISNPDECTRLCEKDYQKELCFSIICGIIEYIEIK